MGFITKAGLKELDNYHYKSGGYTKLDNLMNPFWEWCQRMVPKTCAPNTVTFVGFILMILSYLIMLYHDQTFTKVLPSWVYYLTAIFQLIYQTMDAVDGKHARQTKSSSPLGQLFDHGCDSFSLSFLVLSICQSVRLGPTNEVIFFFCITQIGFFMCNWGEYHTGVLQTNYANFGVTEGELMIAGAVALCGVNPYFFEYTIFDALNHFGVSISSLPSWLAFLVQVQLKDLILKFLYGTFVILIILFITSTVMKAQRKVAAILQFVPVVFNCATTYLWSTLPVFEKHAGLVLLIAGLIFSLNTSRTIICSLTKMDTPIFQLEYVVYFLGYLAASKVFGNHLANMDYNILVGLAIYTAVSAVFWAKGCIDQISSYLGIYCFSLEKRKPIKFE